MGLTETLSSDEWQIDRLDLDGYLARLRIAAREPSLEALAELHEAHVHRRQHRVLLGRPSDVSVDIVIGHHYTSTFPGSHITTGLILTKHLPGCRVTVTDDSLTIRTLGESTEHRPLHEGEIEQWLETLEVPLPPTRSRLFTRLRALAAA